MFAEIVKVAEEAPVEEAVVEEEVVELEEEVPAEVEPATVAPAFIQIFDDVVRTQPVVCPWGGSFMLAYVKGCSYSCGQFIVVFKCLIIISCDYTIRHGSYNCHAKFPFNPSILKYATDIGDSTFHEYMSRFDPYYYTIDYIRLV